MEGRFEKRGGVVRGAYPRPSAEMADGVWLWEMHRIDQAKRSLAANRLLFGALVNEVTRWNREEGKGSALPAAWWHETLKKECLHVLSEREKERTKLRRGRAANGKVVTWRENEDGTPWQRFTSTTQLNSKLFSEYIALAAAVARTRHGYPYDFDFLT